MKITKNIKAEIIAEIKEAGYRQGQLMDYSDLIKLSKRFGRGLSDEYFIKKILDITESNYANCKNGGKRVRILKEKGRTITEEERQEIIEEIKKAGYKSGQKINYEQLQELCRKFGRGLKEEDFALKILGLTYGNYAYDCKNGGSKVKIFKEKEKVITEEERQEIIDEIKKAGYKSSQKINYEELHELYLRFGRGLKKVDFAIEILGIKYSNYMGCKNRGTRAKILKEQGIVTLEERKKIIEEIKKYGYKPGEFISYSEFQELYNRFGRRFTETDFAQKILGINYANFMSSKSKGTKVKIKDGIKLEKSKEIIELYISNSQFYPKEDIEEICKQYNITIDDFITYVYRKNFCDITPFKNALENNNGLWIGKTRMSVEFVNNNIVRINKLATEIAKALCGKYRISKNAEDYRQDLIIYIIETMGDLEKNLGNTEDFFVIIGAKTVKYCQGIIINRLKISDKYEGVYKTSRGEKDDKTFLVEYADENSNVETEVEKKDKRKSIEVDENEIDKCINLLKECIENGMEKKRAIFETAKSMNIDPETMLKYMQKYLLEKGKVKITNGKILSRGEN